MAVLLEIEAVGKSFGGVVAVSGLDLAVDTGEIRGLIGPNGAGKTTLLNLITGIYRPDQGAIRLAGRKVTGLPTHQVNRLGIARTFQNVRLFPQMTVLENVMVGLHARAASPLWSILVNSRAAVAAEQAMRERARELLSLVGLDRYGGTPVGTLPYGQQRLVEIARALATGPQLLLLDEPAAGLVAQEVDELAERVRTVRDRGVTVFLIEHNMEFMMSLCDRLTVLDFGRKIAEGSPEEVQRHPDVIEAYLGRQSDHAAG